LFQETVFAGRSFNCFLFFGCFLRFPCHTRIAKVEFKDDLEASDFGGPSSVRSRLES
jgi:hypothetical protein